MNVDTVQWIVIGALTVTQVISTLRLIRIEQLLKSRWTRLR